MLLATIPPPPQESISIGPLVIHFYGIAIAIGAIAAITLLRYRYRALGGDPDLADRAAIAVAIFAFVGARVGFILPRLPMSLVDMLAVRRGGLTFFGALVGGFIGLLWYTRRKGMHLPTFLHAAAPAVPLAQAIGRWGNYFNQELYGRPTDLPWALEIEPQHVVGPYAPGTTFHPTFLYEMLWNLALMTFLLVLDRRVKLRRGSLFLIYLVGYGAGRFWLELLRIDTPERILGLSRNGWNAIAAMVIGTLLLVWWQRRPELKHSSGHEPGHSSGHEPGHSSGHEPGDDETPARPGPSQAGDDVR